MCERERLLLVRLHIDVDERAEPLGRAEQLAQAAADAAERALGVDGVELAVEGRELDRQVDPRNRPAVVGVDQRIGRPAVAPRA